MSKWLPLNQSNLMDALNGKEPEGDAKSTKSPICLLVDGAGISYSGHVLRFGPKSLVLVRGDREEYINFVIRPWMFLIIAPPSDRQFGVAERQLNL